MRLVFLADARSVHIQRWICFFQKTGDEVLLLTLEETEFADCQKFSIQPKISLDALKYPLALSQVKEAIHNFSPHLVNAHFVPNYGLLGAMSGFRPLVVSVWGSDILISAKKSFLHRLRASWVLKKADWLTSDSFYLTQEMIKLGARGEKISTFPLGVEDDLLAAPLKKIEDRESVTVISIRRLEPVYNLSLLIEAIPSIIERCKKKINFLIVGEGSEKDKLQAGVTRLQLEDKVKFLGDLSRKELISALGTADIYVSTSLSDSTSVSLLEAMSCGLVPIVTDIPGNREWIQEEKNGFLISCHNAQELGERIIRVAEGLANFRVLIEANRKLVEEKANYRANLSALRRKFSDLTKMGEGR